MSLWRLSVPQFYAQKDYLEAVELLSSSDRSFIIHTKNKKTNADLVLKIGPSNGSLLQESASLSGLSHPNIVSLVESLHLGESFCVLLEKAPGVSLIDLLTKERSLNETEAAEITSQLVSALKYLHSKGLIHRDVKPDNVIYDRTSRKLKLIDFEFSRKIRKWRSLSSKKGTIQYSAPEVRKGSYKGSEVDVWSLGVTVFVMVTGHFPFQEEDLMSRQEVFQKPAKITPSCADLLSRMLEKNPKKRITLSEAENHPWFKDKQKVGATT
eukprot:TRINITY_DN3611_c0_g1_i1.p1 TRINITY_DN3611_c0_g1~~TRINITY_DN3611_c0_g1_i1.p1  ORF type:complete len:268 (-),score=56.71 TRINITY_DN3611_c0_g1_i1:206-1009(-)